MGSAIGNLFSDAGADDAEAKAQADLEQLMVMAQKQEQLFQNQVRDYYQNKDTYKEYEVVGGRIVADSSFISTTTSEKVNNDITEGVKGMIGGLFGIDDTDSKDGDESDKHKFQKATENLVSAAFDAIFGSSSGSEMMQQEFFILPFGFTFYRVDAFIWRFTVNAKAGAYEKAKSVYVSVAACGVLDTTDLTPSELISFVQQIEGTDKDNILKWFEDYADVRLKAEELQNQVQDLLDKKNKDL